MPNESNAANKWEGFSEVQELTKKNESLMRALDEANRQVAELSARLETGGPGPAANARESKIVEVSKKNRLLTLSVERERAEKFRALAQLKAAQTRLETLDLNRTESEVERACREVVEEASKSTETAQIELAAMREKWKQASKNAERFSGQKAFIKTENDRLKAIIRKEIGEHVDFGRLDDEIAATGGKKGRAETIRDLRARLDLYRIRLADADDALRAIAAGPNVDDVQTPRDDAMRIPRDDDTHIPTLEPDDVGTVPVLSFGDDAEYPRGSRISEPDAADELDGFSDARRKTIDAARLEAQAHRAEALSREMDTLRRELRTEKDDTAKITKMNRNLETEVRGLLEKVVVLKDKSDHDDKLVDALRSEVRRLQTRSAETAEYSEYSAHAERSGYEAEPASERRDARNNSVPLSEYRSTEARASSLEARLRKQEQVSLHARAKIASLEQGSHHAVLEADRCEQDAFSPAAIAAAAGSAAAGSAAAPKTFKTDVGRVSARRDEDVANLIEHSETLERVCQEMRGKLVVCEKQVEQLRDRVNAERRKYQDLVSRMENAGGSGAGSSTEAGGGGDSTAALRAALEEQREETRRVREKYEYKLESMEQEVELYAEMMAEMKRAAAANASIGESPAPPRRTGFR